MSGAIQDSEREITLQSIEGALAEAKRELGEHPHRQAESTSNGALWRAVDHLGAAVEKLTKLERGRDAR